MFLTTTSDIIRVVTGSAVTTIGVHTDWVDNASGTYTPGRTNTAITTATTTTIVAAPGASTVRNVKSISIENNSAASSSVVTVQHFDGTTSVDIAKVTLAAGETLEMDDDGEWQHLTASGAEYAYGNGNYYNGLGITGTLAESMPRELCSENNLSLLSSGRMTLVGVYIRKGTVVTNISFFSATTAGATLTNQLFGLYTQHGHKLAQSNNDTTTAWAANTIKTLALTTAYTVQVSGVYLLAIMVAATTVPTIKGGPTRSGGAISERTHCVCFNGNTGLTTNLPDTVSIGAGLTTVPWAAIT